ncbi:MAG: ribonuclease HII [Deltaproteobacteria bacterium]|jgi:ribonuclease HII|nr:ribonuclease HII [Deltaproteobacteria bacterium]
MTRRPRVQKGQRIQSKRSCTSDLLSFERELYSKGIRSVAGVDEVGRGPLAGPVVAAAVILPEGLYLEGLRDSKKLTAKKRDRFYDDILNVAISYAVALVEPEEIDRINILKASLLAMKNAVCKLKTNPEYILIDGINEIEHHLPQKTITGGDDLSQSIAAASVVAKVTRDRMMCEFENIYPQFTFSAHKGYGTRAHYSEISRYGLTPLHRRSFLKKLNI